MRSILKGRGYICGKDAGNKYVDHCWYKSFRKNDPDNDRGYVVSLNVYDNSELLDRFPTISPFSMKFSMIINHQTKMDMEKFDLSMMKDGMDVEEFERYCDRLYDALMMIMPTRKTEQTA